MHAEVAAYRGRIVIELKTKRSIPGEVITSLDTPRMGSQIIINTSKNLGVSKEALQLLKQVHRGANASGDVNWSSEAEGSAAFGWVGGCCAIFSPATCEASKQFKVRGYVTIDNEVPEGARRQLDKYARLPGIPIGILTNIEL
ncbi:MAG: hypothetical protein Q7S87_03125 [Agitococcus sp.]|nr:hypothetical protein [Agitococcus sp.]